MLYFVFKMCCEKREKEKQRRNVVDESVMAAECMSIAVDCYVRWSVCVCVSDLLTKIWEVFTVSNS